MTASHHTALIVGGGPAGSTAAHALAMKGVDVCVIDRREFPRDKLCGGLLTIRSRKLYQQIYGEGWDAFVEAMGSGVKFYKRAKPIAPLKGEENKVRSTLYFTQRFNFDHALLQRASSAGARMRLGVGVETVDNRAKRIMLADGKELTFDYLIGADGVNSSVARALYGKSFDQRTIGFALEVDVAANRLPGSSNVPEIHFGDVAWGYGWVFPKQGVYTVGLGGRHADNPDLRERFDRFLRARLGTEDVTDLKAKGHFLPFGEFRTTPGEGTVLLCGDAAGLVDSITGEGIAFAMQSGQAAALAVAEAATLGQPGRAFELYRGEYAKITSHIMWSNRYRHLIFPAYSQWLFLRLLPDASTIQQGYLDLIAGDIEYEDIPGVLWEQVKKAIRKKFGPKASSHKPQ